MEDFLSRCGVLFTDVKVVVSKQAERLEACAPEHVDDSDS